MWAFFAILIILGIVAIAGWAKLYVKTPVNMAFIRTGLGGKKVVIVGGAVVWPYVQSIQWISLETFKLEVFKANKEAFITKDRLRVDIGAEFSVKIPAEHDSIERASRSLGDKSFSAEGIQSLVEEKLVSALRSVSAKMEMIEIHENRRGFAVAVMENLKNALVPNGLSLEGVSIYHFDQTDRAQLDPTNIFDAEGLRQISAQTSQRPRERNEIERNTEVAIKKKGVEAVKLKLALDQEREFAEAEQMKAVEVHKAQRKAEAEEVKYREEQRIREAEILSERAIREADFKRETYLVREHLVKEQTEIEKERALEESRRAKEITILIKEREWIEEERRRLAAEASKELAAQEVVTAAEKAAAQRAKEIALGHALREVEVTTKKAEAMERLALAKMKDGEAEAHARKHLREADNTIEPKVISRDILLSLIEKSPQLVGELMAPPKQIDSIKILDVHGLSGAGGGNGGDSAVGKVIGAFLNAGAALPLLKELLDFAKVEPEQAIRRIAEQLPGLKEAFGSAPSGSRATEK